MNIEFFLTDNANANIVLDRFLLQDRQAILVLNPLSIRDIIEKIFDSIWIQKIGTNEKVIEMLESWKMSPLFPSIIKTVARNNSRKLIFAVLDRKSFASLHREEIQFLIDFCAESNINLTVVTVFPQLEEVLNFIIAGF